MSEVRGGEPAAKPRILIVDDEANVRTALKRWFELAQFDVDVAEDGMVAVDKCRAGRYDIITMDLEMPRMNGVDATLRIREFLPDVPIVVLTGFHTRPDQIYRMNAARILHKPISLHELEKEVREAMIESRIAGAPPEE